MIHKSQLTFLLATQENENFEENIKLIILKGKGGKAGRWADVMIEWRWKGRCPAHCKLYQCVVLGQAVTGARGRNDNYVLSALTDPPCLTRTDTSQLGKNTSSERENGRRQGDARVPWRRTFRCSEGMVSAAQWCPQESLGRSDECILMTSLITKNKYLKSLNTRTNSWSCQ